MNKNSRIAILVLLFSVSLSIFFPIIIQAEEKATPQEQLASDEMGIYVIYHSIMDPREGFWVACNENIMSNLSRFSRGYCYFKVKTGPDIINITASRIPFIIYLLKFRPGETEYLFYENGIISQVAPYIGAELINETQNVPLLKKVKPNEAYEYSLLNPGFYINEHMKKTDQLISPDADHAVITFVRPKGFIASEPFGIWSETEYLGTLRPHTFFQIKVKPGKHFFIGKSADFSVIEADVAAGEKYYVELTTSWGIVMSSTKSQWGTGIQLRPVKKEIVDDPTLQQWLASAIPVTFDQNSITDDVKAVMDQAKPVLGMVLDQVANGKIITEKLEAGDAR